jgi:hypothetical protein
MKTLTLLTLVALSLTLAAVPLAHFAGGQPAVSLPAPSADVSVAPNAPEPEAASVVSEPTFAVAQPSVEIIPAAPQEPEADAAPAVSVAVSEPAIRLTPDSGAAGSEISVEGVGFAPGLSLGIYVSVPNAGYGPDTLATATTDEQGAFQINFVLPADWPISQPALVVIAGTADGSVKAIAPFACQIPLPTATI